jgi:hypothetical protein
MRTCTKQYCTTEASPPLIVCDDHELETQSSVALGRGAQPQDEWRERLRETFHTGSGGQTDTGDTEPAHSSHNTYAGEWGEEQR